MWGAIVRGILRAWGRFRRTDWRVVAVVLVLVVAVILTLVPFFFLGGDWLKPEKFLGAVFASWVGGVVLFVVAGVVVAIVSLARPEDESFDARARILFRRQTGKHIDYIVHRISETLEHYAEFTECIFSISNHDAQEKKYRLSYESTVMVRSYLDDVKTSYDSAVNYSGVTKPPAGKASNELVYVRADNVPIGRREPFETEISRDVRVLIEPDAICKVEHKVDFWALADDEPNSHSPKRYTQVLRLLIENTCDLPQPVKIKFTTDGGTSWNYIDLSHGECKPIVQVRDVRPGAEAFDFRVLGPLEPAATEL